jgi:LemA protein
MPQVLARTCGGLPRALFLVYFPCHFVPQELSAMSTGWIVLGVIVIIVLFAFGAYNRLALSQRVSQAFADIDVQLKQRHDLIPNLVETVKGYAQHERGTLDDVIKARNSAMSAQGPAQVSAAENQLRVRSGA